KRKSGLPQGVPLIVQKRVVGAGDRLVSASQGFDQNGQPDIQFRFDSVGATEFADITKAAAASGIKQCFAVVIDKEIIPAPTINEPILGGSGIIMGSFT